ncbi:serine/threonine-protein kinase [Mycobacterium sp. RTGN5]|uniref:serine/threonine-protein kinase n=1 Tax=Mycobacterium sp. RTGN5 TaxID=3016522 RepID=UPI0029C861CB|nr:protein kinase [Mycobacterium sp. RTGN5]
MPLGAGEVFAGYTVVRRLGAGAMGEVYLVQHPRLPRRDALKLLTASTETDPTFRDRFMREADLVCTLRHPHIVGVLDRGEFQGRLWIAMEYIDGEDVAAALAHRYPDGMPAELVSEIVAAVASALDYAHRQRLLHRDVKPANILIAHPDDADERRILLSDFGIARTMDEHNALTATNMTVGTVNYASPEQLMGEALDGRADQYSLAATAYQLLTGRPMFADSNAAVVISRHLSAAVPRLADIRPELAELDPAFGIALAKSPGNRFPTCGVFAQALAEQLSVSPDRGSSLAATLLAPVSRGESAPDIAGAQVRTQPPAPLTPGWYPNPTGAPGALYWDGRDWRTALPPNTSPSTPSSNSTGRSRNAVVLTLAIAVPLILAGAGFLVWNQRATNPGPDSSAAIATRDTQASSPTLPNSIPARTVTVPAKPSTTTVLMPPPLTTVESPAATSAAFGMIQGTCDEGDSCGLKQRTAPYTDAPRLYPDDLHDGAVVTMVCQTTGDLRSNAGVGSSRTWFRLANGAYVNAVYVTTGATQLAVC